MDRELRGTLPACFSRYFADTTYPASGTYASLVHQCSLCSSQVSLIFFIITCINYSTILICPQRVEAFAAVSGYGRRFRGVDFADYLQTPLSRGMCGGVGSVRSFHLQCGLEAFGELQGIGKRIDAHDSCTSNCRSRKFGIVS